jgi:DNA-binding MarR family transcriptional regulator/GNAT superfamily N-acetyltransferase
MHAIAAIRSFNRAVTRRIGALDERFLGRNRSLGASRLLFEIGPRGSEVRQLRSRLGLDSGYASRLLRNLEREGLVRSGPSPDDGRVRFVELTPEGRRELGILNRLSDRAAAAMVEPLTDRQREALVDAMALVEKLLCAGAVRVELADATSSEGRACLERYFAELAARFEAGFEPAGGVAAAAREFTPPGGAFVVARLDGAVGCGGVRFHGGYGEIKRMWVAPQARGMGIARRILRRLEDLFSDRGLRIVRLDTNRVLAEAQALYRSSGYREIPRFNENPYAHHWFEKTLRPSRSSTAGA